MKPFLRLFFKLLYHQCAFAYDWVAAAVSFNRWREWIECVTPFIRGRRILELGHGPGHLHRLLLWRGLDAVAIDESPQMGMLAKDNSLGAARIARGLAQALPFCNDAFDTIVSTFPTDYIFDARTLSELGRCLIDGGEVIVLPIVMPKSRFLDWLYRVTGESPAEAEGDVARRLSEPFLEAGFQTDVKILDLRSSRLFVMLAGKHEEWKSA